MVGKILQYTYLAGVALFAIIVGLAGKYGAAVLSLAIGVFAWWLVRQLYRDAQKRAAVAAEKKRQLEEAAEAERVMQERRRWDDLVSRFGNERAQRILNRIPLIGDSKEMIVEMLGRPVDIDNKETKTKSIEVYKYAQKGKDRYGLTFKFENDELVEWSDKR